MNDEAFMNSDVVIKKFGGTSLGTLEQIQAVAQRVLEDQKEGQKPVVVASAMSGETNRLIGLAEAVFPGFRGPAYDMLLASGEQVSIALLCLSLQRLGATARPFLAHQLGIFTDSLFSKARIQKIETQKLLTFLEEGGIPVIAGFQGVNAEQDITTLGRGGSDTSAVALASALEASFCEIYTDVPAVYSGDPRWIPKAHPISSLSFEEMMEMASLGCRILNIRSVEMAFRFQIRIHVRSSFEKRPGTWITPTMQGNKMEHPLITAVTHEASTVVIKLFPLPSGSEALATLFDRLAQKGIVVDIITQSYIEGQQRVTFSIPKEDKIIALDLLPTFLPECKIEVLDDVSKVSVVGVGMRNHPGVAAQFFDVFSQMDVPIHLISTSEIKISAIVDQIHLEKAIRRLHTRFHLDQEPDKDLK